MLLYINLNQYILVYMESEEIKFENTPEEEIVLHTHFIVVTKEYGEYKVYDPGQISYYNIDLDSYMGSTYDFEDIVWFRVFY